MASEITYQDRRDNLINEILNSDLHGKRIYILGSSEFGPTNEPILCRSTVGVKTKFGKYGTLIDAFHKIKSVSKDNNIYLVKTTGEHSSTYLNVNTFDGEIIHKGFIVTASESNEIYNEIKIIVETNYLGFQLPTELGGNTYKYYYNEYKYIEKLVDAINKEPKNKIYVHYNVDPMTRTDIAFYPCNPPELYLNGGQCGLEYTKNMLYNCLDRTYEILESEDIDIIIPIQAFMDDIYPNDMYADEIHYGKKYYQPTKDYLTENTLGTPLSYMNQLINFCLSQLNFGVVTHGILGFNPSYKEWSDIYNQSNDITKMYKACFEYNLKCCDNPFYSFLVSVIGGDIKYNKTEIDNGYLAYSALCSKILITEGTTNIPISNSISIYHELEEEYLSELSDTGIVMFRHSPLYETPVVYDGITAFIPNEEFPNNELKLFANIRMIQLAISYLNKLFQFYVGMNINDLISNETMDKDIRKILNALVKKDIITKYSFTIVPYYSWNEIRVYLNLESCYMIKPITICPIINIEYEEEGDSNG